jgi:hypothetical protein
MPAKIDLWLLKFLLRTKTTDCQMENVITSAANPKALVDE